MSLLSESQVLAKASVLTVREVGNELIVQRAVIRDALAHDGVVDLASMAQATIEALVVQRCVSGDVELCREDVRAADG